MKRHLSFAAGAVVFIALVWAFQWAIWIMFGVDAVAK